MRKRAEDDFDPKRLERLIEENDRLDQVGLYLTVIIIIICAIVVG